MSKTNLSDDALRSLVSKITRRPEDKIKADSKLRADLGLDSMLSLELLVTLEEQHSLVIPQEEVYALETFQDLANHIRSKG